MGPARLKRELVRLRAGSDAAFCAVYQEYLPVIEHYLRTFLREQDAHDIAQQVFLDVFQHRATASEVPSRFEHWLFMIARHRAFDLIRKLRRVDVADVAEVNALRERRGSAAPANGPDLAAAVSRLPSRHQEALALRYLYALTTAEIASATGRSRDAVRQFEHRILAELRASRSPKPPVSNSSGSSSTFA